jgi:hypothetical protein
MEHNYLCVLALSSSTFGDNGRREPKPIRPTMAAAMRVRPEARKLVLEGAIADFALPMEEHRAP